MPPGPCAALCCRFWHVLEKDILQLIDSSVLQGGSGKLTLSTPCAVLIKAHFLPHRFWADKLKMAAIACGIPCSPRN